MAKYANRIGTGQYCRNVPVLQDSEENSARAKKAMADALEMHESWHPNTAHHLRPIFGLEIEQDQT